MQFRKEVITDGKAQAKCMVCHDTAAESCLPGGSGPVKGELIRRAIIYDYHVLDDVISSSPCLQS